MILANSGNDGQVFSFAGGALTILIQSASGATVQTINLNFPSATFPTPKLTPWWNARVFADYPPVYVNVIQGQDLVQTSMCTFDKVFGNGSSRLMNNEGVNFRTLYMFIPSEMNCSEFGNDPSVPWGQAGLNRISCDTFRSVEVLYGDTRLIASLPAVPSNFFAPNPYYNYSQPYYVNGWQTYMRSGHSLRAADTASVGTEVTGLSSISGTSNDVEYPSGEMTVGGISGIPASSGTSGYPSATGEGGSIVDEEMSRGVKAYNGTGTDTGVPYTTPSVDFTNPTFQEIWQNGGDFDNGLSMYSDGPFINKADEGAGGIGGVFISNPYYSIDYSPLGSTLYFPNREVPSPVMFGSLPIGFGQIGNLTNPSPNMLLDSWRTLLFCPDPNSPAQVNRDARAAAAGYSEEGEAPPPMGAVPDFLILDFFRMPIVEPFAISDAYSTNGKVNMNCQIAPFTYITRDTALRGVLKASQITAVDDQFSFDYKARGSGDNSAAFGDTTKLPGYPSGFNSFGAQSNYQYFRYPVFLDETLYQMEQRFVAGDLYRSPSEICNVWLYPANQASMTDPAAPQSLLSGPEAVTLPGIHDDANHDGIKARWNANPGVTRKSLTGTNLRDRPYATIYPRLTTQSNTYRVHFRVQALRKALTTDPLNGSRGRTKLSRNPVGFL